MARTFPSKDSLGAISGATDVFALTKHDTNEMPANRGFMVNVAGDVAIRAVDSSADVTLTVVAGVMYPIAIKFLRSASTTASGLFGFK